MFGIDPQTLRSFVYVLPDSEEEQLWEIMPDQSKRSALNQLFDAYPDAEIVGNQ